MTSTRPTTTPAAFTGARSLRPPMLSNAASRWYVGAVCSEVRLPTLSARNTIAPMPIVTKMPTHRSIVARFTSHRPPEHEHGQDEVEREDRERRADDGACGRRGHALGGRLGVVALEHRDQADR